MKRALLIFFFLIFTGCSTRHDIGFINVPCLKPFSAFDFELGGDFMIQVSDRIYIVPKGFITDLASVPRIMWAFYPPNDTRTIRASVFHDYLYSGKIPISRREADAILYDALIYQDVSAFTAFKYWLGVRVFGEPHFTEYKEMD